LKGILLQGLQESIHMVRFLEKYLLFLYMSSMSDQNHKTPLVLLILDGWGHRAEKKDNGIELAHKDFFDSLMKNYPHTLIDGSGPAVGLPPGIMGNSEVGHMNLGAGRIVYSGLAQIYQAIADKTLFTNPALIKAIHQVKTKKSTLHFLGLLSDGAVHSHQDHLFSLLDFARHHGVSDVALHLFLDGRDTAPCDGIHFVRKLKECVKKTGVGRVASVSGRYYAMDRDQRWDRVAQAFQAMQGLSENNTADIEKYILDAYAKGIGDEFMLPVSVVDDNGKTTSIDKNDAMIFFNFRADRARQISHAFVDEVFSGFDRGESERPQVYVCLYPYEAQLKADVALRPEYPQRIFGEILSEKGLTQLRIAETEKYAHVTFFFNGGRDEVFPGEDRVLIPSPKEVSTYDKKPEMSAFLVKDELLKRLHSGVYDVVIGNFANTDMVGHTAVPNAIFKAVETVDQCLSEIVPVILALGGTVLITADHGNAEEMVDKNGAPMTAHTVNLVPFLVVSDKFKSAKLKSGGRLCDVAPTMLKILGLAQPEEMTGESFL
jgi:2,3-bisphosphoglycerate-independent phosphoglycerate mutase